MEFMLTLPPGVPQSPKSPCRPFHTKPSSHLPQKKGREIGVGAEGGELYSLGVFLETQHEPSDKSWLQMQVQAALGSPQAFRKYTLFSHY